MHRAYLYMKIEDIILQYADSRNINKLRKYLAPDFCEQAANAILVYPGKVFLTTGFWVGGTCETDGPVGAIVLADVLRELGSEPVFVTDRFCADILRRCRSYRVIDFPILSHKESRQAAHLLLHQERPSLLISIERCGMGHDGKYYNMRKVDISDTTAKVDYLFQQSTVSIGIGDGGNEIGMGNVCEEIRFEGLPIYPAVTRVTYPVIATVSNWAAYGIVAYISQKQQVDYMKYIRVREILKQLTAQGVVDGVTRETTLSVDGFPLAEIEGIVAQLSQAISSPDVETGR